MGDATLKTKSNSIFREIWKHKLCYLAILPSIAFLLFFCLYPAFTGVFRSFFRWKTKNYFSPEFCGFDNYARLFRDKTFCEVLAQKLDAERKKVYLHAYHAAE